MIKIHLLFCIFIFYLKTHQSICITVLDSKKSFNYDQHNPNFKRYKDVLNSTKSALSKAYNSSINEIKTYPISTTLTGVSLCVSSLVWSKCVNVNDIKPRGDIKSLNDLFKNILNLFLIPEFNGNSILNIVSFYLTLKSLESKNGFNTTLKMISLDSLIGLLFSGLIIKKLNLNNYSINDFDFNKFSKSLVSLSCFNSPEESILVYGLIRTKNKYFPPILVLSDYLLTLQTSSLVNSLVGVLYGLISLLTYNLLYNS